MLCEVAEELVALRRMRRLVGYGPDNDIGTVLVAAYHIGELTLSILIGLRIGPCNSPIDWYL